MAHGAPDHVRMSDVNLLDYVDKVFTDRIAVIPGLDNILPVDVTGVGCFGSIHFETDYKSTEVEIIVDGITLVQFYLFQVWHALRLGGNSSYPNYGVTRYDQVNDSYVFWMNFNWLLSFKKSLLIRLSNAAVADANLAELCIFWKERG